ncbi:uncharacterized protein LOC129915390 isoform X1 [Episyrphus balteatus]|uniref:uncharacterized protein LOC129915390 isoform X1 n=1 Tax=Episyrphus balteatus TaxID=286459 RepID=UPI002486668A|nr:uncharacterized protein LOC129915390 isoform X1 [Episyrphus balteatus]
MLPPSQTQKCAMVQLYCSEQIAIPETFPNILKTYAKAAIRTQPYDLLRWSADYFRCLANNAPPPAKIRLERACRQGSITKGYLKVLVAQVGKGFFISRCLLQERWKALCLDEDDLLKYLSLCRMLNWPQVHWLKVLAVMIGSLNESPNDTMVMLCELLTDDMDGGLARIPYWMFKICYTFVAKLECSQEQCFVNGQLVLPWGDLEEATPMQRLPRVLSASLLKDTIITSCKAKFDKSYYKGVPCPVDSSSDTTTMDFMINSNLGDAKELFDKCEDFDTIMLLLQDAQTKPLTEEDFKGPHYISEKQLEKAHKKEEKLHTLRQQQAENSANNANEVIQQEAFQMLHEVGPPWTWLHQFTEKGQNTASYNFIDQESIKSFITGDCTSSVESFDLIKEEPKEIDEKSSSSSCKQVGLELENKSSIESLKSLIEEAEKQHKCDTDKTSSVISFLKSDEQTILQLTGEPFEPRLNLPEVISILERAEANGLVFSSLEQIIDHIRKSYLGNVADFPTITTKPEKHPPSCQIDDISLLPSNEGSISIPSEWKETIPKQVNKPPPTIDPTQPSESKLDEGHTASTQKDEITKVFENTVGIPPEQVAKMPKFCFETKDEDELVLGLVPVAKPLEKVELEEDMGSVLSRSSADGIHVSGSEGGYRQDDEDILKDESEVSPKEKALVGDRDYFCCMTAPTLKPPTYEPPQQYHCTIKAMPGIGATVSQKTIDDFLAFLRVRSRSQRGLINPRNFKEERCPAMVDTTLHLSN